MLAAVFPQKSMRFRHNDTYGIAPKSQKSIPDVSNRLRHLGYDWAMEKRDDSWKSWGLRLRNHLKEHKSSLAKLADKMLDEDGEPIAESTLRSWTNGNRKINLEDFFHACKEAGANPAVILFGRPIMSDAMRKEIGDLVVAALEADPSANPDYGQMITKINKTARKHKSPA